jgi:adenosylmethionine-8-amino-7-oxononanoate aminotransferase
MSSWGACIHSYNHPTFAAAMAQMNKMSHVMLGWLTHEPVVQLAKALSEITPSNETIKFDKVFYCNSGSVAVEVAL